METPDTDTKKTFADLGVDKAIVDALKKMEIINPTGIQAESIPFGLKGEDVIGRAKTGSGKTIAFSIPIVQELAGKEGRGIKAIILAPTRELAKQVDEELRSVAEHTKLQTAVIYGGVEYEPQFAALEKADILIGTPGRILDHMERKTVDLGSVEFFVLDEADRMLDMGFIDDIKRVLAKTPPHKQSFFFSATMPGEARDLAESFMHDPKYVAMKDVYVDNDLLTEWYIDVIATCKADMCAEVLKREEPELALIFVNSRLFTDKLAEYLEKQGFSVKALHGGHAQNKREKMVSDFEKGEFKVLVATDVAARGLDIEGITHVINFEVPRDAQTYTHRIGRTARAGAAGTAITLLDREEHREFSRIEGDSLRDINKYEIDYRPKKVYFLPRRDGPRDDRGRGRGRGGPRRHGSGGHGRGGHGRGGHGGGGHGGPRRHGSGGRPRRGKSEHSDNHGKRSHDPASKTYMPKV